VVGLYTATGFLKQGYALLVHAFVSIKGSEAGHGDGVICSFLLGCVYWLSCVDHSRTLAMFG